MESRTIQQYLTYIPVLQASTLFHQRDTDEIRLFLQRANTLCRTYQKGEFISIYGEPMEGIGVVLEGSALLTRENIQGHRTIVITLETAAIFGEALLFTTHPTWPATIQACEPTTILFIPFDTFANPLPECESLQTGLLLNLLRDLSEKTLVLNRKVHYLTLKSMRSRIMAYVEDLSRLQQSQIIHLPHNRQEMADVLNVSRPSMCRELGRLIDEGFIRLDGRTLTLLRSLD